MLRCPKPDDAGSNPAGPARMDHAMPPIIDYRRDDPICANCHQRPATIIWVGEGGMLAYTHGGGVWWCKFCATEAQLAYAKAAALRIPELEQQLATLRQETK